MNHIAIIGIHNTYILYSIIYSLEKKNLDMELKNSVESSQSKNTFAGMYIK